MTYIRVYKHNRLLVNTLIWAGSAFAVLFVVLFIVELFNPGEEQSPLIPWNFLGLTLYGVLLAGSGLKARHAEKKFFVEWDDESIRWWLPRSKKIQTIKISEIRSIEIEKLLVKIGLDDKQKIFSLKFFYYPERNTIQKKFEEIKKSMSG